MSTLNEIDVFLSALQKYDPGRGVGGSARRGGELASTTQGGIDAPGLHAMPMNDVDRSMASDVRASSGRTMRLFFC